MTRCVVDTNVAIVANGRSDSGDARTPSTSCREAAVTLLMSLVKTGTVLLDSDGAIQNEYRRHLNPRGQPGVGDRFYQVILHSSPNIVERRDLPRHESGEYVDLPQQLLAVNFDPSDRKFAAMANRYSVPVYNATDSDWVNAAAALAAAKIDVRNLCGRDKTQWFMS